MSAKHIALFAISLFVTASCGITADDTSDYVEELNPIIESYAESVTKWNEFVTTFLQINWDVLGIEAVLAKFDETDSVASSLSTSASENFRNLFAI